MKKVLTVVVVLALLTLFGGTLWYLWRKAQKPVVVYDTEKPSVTDIVKKTVATGSVIPRKEVAVKPQVSGIIEAIRVEPGQDVRRGDLLATIRVVPNTAALAAAESRVYQATFRADDAAREFARLQKLAADGIVSDKEFRQATLAKDTATEELAAAKDSLEVVRRGVAARSGNASNTKVVASPRSVSRMTQQPSRSTAAKGTPATRRRSVENVARKVFGASPACTDIVTRSVSPPRAQ